MTTYRLTYFDIDGGMDQAIAIRTLVFGDGRYSFQAGAGIVADSVPELENKECGNKARALLAAVVEAESGFDPRAESRAGARGLRRRCANHQRNPGKRLVLAVREPARDRSRHRHRPGAGTRFLYRGTGHGRAREGLARAVHCR